MCRIVGREESPMEFSAIALIELGVVMAFVLGWGILSATRKPKA